MCQIPETPLKLQQPFSFTARALALAAVAALGACTSINNSLQGEKVDYKTSGAKSVSLEVPPDLTQLSRDSRYQVTGGSISAAALQTPVATPVPRALRPPARPARRWPPIAVGDVRLERAGTQRWLVTKQTPEQLWPQLQAFWGERGFQLDLEQRDTGVMETNWNENRAKLPQDIIRSTIGRVFDSAYDTGERDRFPAPRLERNAEGSTEIYISHRGMVEVYNNRAQGQHDLAAPPGRSRARSDHVVSPDDQAGREGRTSQGG